jgi:hypothetical protein
MEPSKTTSVLVSFAFLVDAPVGRIGENEVIDTTLEAYLDNFADRVRDALSEIRDGLPNEADQGVTFNYLEEEQNAAHCARCGRWISDYRKPNFLYTLRHGEEVDGQPICLEHRHDEWISCATGRSLEE